MAMKARELKGFVKFSTPSFVENDKQWYTWYFVTETTAQLEETLRGEGGENAVS